MERTVCSRRCRSLSTEQGLNVNSAYDRPDWCACRDFGGYGGQGAVVPSQFLQHPYHVLQPSQGLDPKSYCCCGAGAVCLPPQVLPQDHLCCPGPKQFFAAWAHMSLWHEKVHRNTLGQGYMLTPSRRLVGIKLASSGVRSVPTWSPVSVCWYLAGTWPS